MCDNPKPDEDLEEDLKDEAADRNKLATKYLTNTHENVIVVGLQFPKGFQPQTRAFSSRLGINALRASDVSLARRLHW